jgi:hypothetical protein
MYKKIVGRIIPKKDTTDILSLYKKPTPEKGPNEVPQFQDFVEGAIQQCDILFLPEDHGYKYLLVCVDDSTRKVDAQPLKSKLTTDVVKAFIKYIAEIF